MTVQSQSQVTSSIRLSPCNLIDQSQKCYKQFNPAQVSLDTHLDSYLKNLRKVAVEDQKFIRQVVYGVTRYSKFIGAFIKLFYSHNSTATNRGDMIMYRILTYITLFRLQELGFKNYETLMCSQESIKVLVFLKFVFLNDNLNNICRADWLALHDKQHVDEMITKVLSYSNEATHVIHKLESTVYLTKEEKKDFQIQKSVKVTKSSPFKLSESTKKVCNVEWIQLPVKKSKAAPKQGKQLPQQTQDNNKKRDTKAVKASRGPKLLTFQRTHSKSKKKQPPSVQADNFESVKARPVPNYPEPEVKVTATQILREDAVYNKQFSDQRKDVDQYLQGLRDSKEFEQWKCQMEKQDEEDKQLAAQKLKQKVNEQHESAIAAKLGKIAFNASVASDVKEQAKELQSISDTNKKTIQESNLKKKTQIVSERKRIAEVKGQLVQEKNEQAKQQREEAREQARKIMEETAAEQQRKKDVIRQLRALENVPKLPKQQKEAVDSGLLEQMTLFELQERLKQQQVIKDQEISLKRQKIIDQKSKRDKLMQDKVSKLRRIKDVAKSQRSEYNVKKQIAKDIQQKQQQENYEEGVVKMYHRMQERREVKAKEARRIAADERRIKFELEVAAAGASQVEEKKFIGQRSHYELTTKTTQQNKLKEWNDQQQTEDQLKKLRERHAKSQVQSTKEFLKDYDQKLNALLAQDKLERQKTLEMKQQKYQARREFDRKQKLEKRSMEYVPSTEAVTGIMERITDIGKGTLVIE